MENRADASGRKRFEKALGSIRQVIAFIAARNRLEAAEREDFGSYVMVKLIEDDYRRIRQFRGESRFETYITVVVQRLFLDYRTQLWGKWRGSARARALGPRGMLLEKLLYRDGLDWREARRALELRGVRMGDDELDRLVHEIPRRLRPRYVPTDCLDRIPDRSQGLEYLERERRQAVRRLEAALASAAGDLDEVDRLILKLRFMDGRTVKEIAGTLGLLERPVYTRLRGLLRRLRKALEDQGFDRTEARVFWSEGVDIDAESALGGPSAPGEAWVR